jgi:hypothetical protein
MRKGFFKELEELERLMLGREARMSAGQASGTEVFRELFRRHAVETSGKESAAEATARIADVSTRKLLDLLTERYR